uniref:Rho guanine nucleotide exchange factor (GEF) 1 n=1 Tax=Oncorhynchus mykiss TaxID=8022 RepID=A0A8C7S5G8_ONCMY
LPSSIHHLSLSISTVSNLPPPSLSLVKSRPTHLLVFLQHVILQFDCSSLLCYLHADLFKNLSTKETKKQFVEFYNSFLDKSAHGVYVISLSDRTRPDLLSEEQQRKFVQDVQLAQAPEVLRQLEDFRQKRMMGMTPNAAELLEVESHYPTDRIPMEMKEKAVAETLLDKMSEIHSSIFAAVAFYMKHLGVKSRVADSKKSRGFFRRPLGKIILILSPIPFIPIPLYLPLSSSSVLLSSISVDEGVLLPEGVLPGLSLSGPTPQQEEQDPRLLELEQDPPNWREHTPPDTLKDLSKKETKRQEVINELFATEHAHVRMLSVLQTVFWKPLEREELMTATELATIFPSLDEIIDMHYAFYEHLKKLRQHNFIVKAIGTTLLNRFGGTEGEWFQKLTSRFCSHQTWALEQLKMRQKKDPRFNSFILEAESRPQCRRLQLKDIIPTEMQRLTKYPLLLENIAKCTEDTLEKESIQQSAECCRKILNHVNEEVKQMENLLTLKDYQRRLDTSGLKPSNELYLEYKYLDLAQRRMIYEGPLTWRVTKEKTLEVQCVLLGDLLVLLQKQDDKMVLKCQSKSNIAVQEGKQMLSPIIKLDSAFLREVATDRKAFYVIFTWDSGAQIYELVAQSVGERKNLPAADHISFSLSLSFRFPQPPLSPTENGVLLKNSIGENRHLTDEMKSVDSHHSLIDYLSDKGFDLIGHSNSDQVKVANSALNEVMYLKRLLVGSISLSDDSQPDEQNGREGPESQDQGLQGEEGEGGGGEGGGMKIDEEGGISAPLILSQERMEEVRRKLQSLEVQLKRLQSVEEEHHRLQQALSKFSLEGGNF